MSVENADVIDFVVRSPKTREILLVMVEVRDQSATPEALQQLQVKFKVYAEYVLSGALAEQHPDLADYHVAIRLDHFASLPDCAAQILRQWANRLAGIKVGVCSHRLYWNPVRNILHSLAARLFGSGHGVVRWTAEPGSSPALISHAQFTEEFAADLRQAMPDAQVAVAGDMELRVVAPTGMDSRCYLGNAYNSYSIDPENKTEVLRKFVASFREHSSDMATGIDKSRLVPILKDKEWIEETNQAIKARDGAKAIGSVHEAYNEELAIVYAQDTPTNVRYLTSEDFVELNLEMTELRSLAMANLKKLVAEPDVRFEEGLYRVKAGGDYDACVLLLEDFWDHAEIPVDGELVAAVPARDFLAVAGSKDRDSVARLRSTAQSIAAQASYRLTAKLFVRRSGKFVVYET